MKKLERRELEKMGLSEIALLGHDITKYHLVAKNHLFKSHGAILKVDEVFANKEELNHYLEAEFWTDTYHRLVRFLYYVAKDDSNLDIDSLLEDVKAEYKRTGECKYSYDGSNTISGHDEIFYY